MTKKLITTTSIFTAAAAVSLVAVKPAFADMYGCQPTYGNNCTPTQILVNKTVQDPQSKNFVDNLGVNDAKYSLNQEVDFRIAVTNPGTADLKNVQVVDTLPTDVSFVAGQGNFDSNSHKLTFTIDALKAGETKTYEVKAKTPTTLANNQTTACDTNLVNASVNGATAQDTAQFCMQTQVTTKGGLPVLPNKPVKQTPPTGPETFGLLGLLSSGALGAILRRKTK